MLEFPLEIETFAPGVVLVLVVCHTPKTFINLYESYQVWYLRFSTFFRPTRYYYLVFSSFSHPDDMFAAAIDVMNKNEKYWHISVCACTRRSNKAGLSAKFQSESNLTRGLNRTMADGNWYMSPHHVENRQFIYIYIYISNIELSLTAKKRHDCLSNLTWNTRWSSLGSCSMSPCGGGSWSSKGRFFKKLFLCIKFTSPPQCTLHTKKTYSLSNPGLKQTYLFVLLFKILDVTCNVFILRCSHLLLTLSSAVNIVIYSFKAAFHIYLYIYLCLHFHLFLASHICNCAKQIGLQVSGSFETFLHHQHWGAFDD